MAKDFPMMRSIEIFGPGPTGWQVLPLESESFESDVLKACELVLRGDVRLGKVPKARISASQRAKKKI